MLGSALISTVGLRLPFHPCCLSCFYVLGIALISTVGLRLWIPATFLSLLSLLLGSALISTVGLRRRAGPTSYPTPSTTRLGSALISMVGLRLEPWRQGSLLLLRRLGSALISTVGLRQDREAGKGEKNGQKPWNCPDQYGGIAITSPEHRSRSARRICSEFP